MRDQDPPSRPCAIDKTVCLFPRDSRIKLKQVTGRENGQVTFGSGLSHELWKNSGSLTAF